MRNCLALLWSLVAAGAFPASAATSVLVADSLNNAVRAYSVTGTNWAYTGVFANGMFDGLPLSTPVGLAQDAAGTIYVGESTATGRILRFSTNATYLGALGTNGVQFSGGNPQALQMGPDGRLYMSLAFGTTPRIYRFDLAAQSWSLFVNSSGPGYSLNNPRGLAFGPDGHLVVADRNGNALRKFHGSAGVFLSNLVSAVSLPQAISWDAANNRFLVTRTFNGVIESVTSAGAVTAVYTQSAADGFLDVEWIEGRVAFTRYDSDHVDLVTGTTTAQRAVTGLNGPGHLLVATLPYRAPVEPPGCPALPGTAVFYSPASSSIYLGSPAIAILPNGDYLASHDYFGSGSTEGSVGQCFVYRSTDRGTNWSAVGEVRKLVTGTADNDGQYWSKFLQLNGALYALGNSSTVGPMIMRRSTNSGATWTYVNDTADHAGRLLLSTNGSRPGQTYVLRDGRMWVPTERPKSATWADNYLEVCSFPTNGDPLLATNWNLSTAVAPNTAWLGGTFRGWLEPNLVEDRLGGLVIVARADNRYANGAGIGGKAAVVRVSANTLTGAATTSFSGGDFDPADPSGSGFVDFPGGITRFNIRFDAVSGRYWTLCNYIPRAFRSNAYNAERFRAILALASSADLRAWSVERIVLADRRLYSSDPTVVAAAFTGNETAYGFQYADWQIDGNDLVTTVRTSFCDNLGGPNSGHNANYYLYQRVANFRVNAGPESVRITSAALTNGAVQVHFTTRPALLYRLLSSSDLATWTDAGLSLEGAGSEAVFEAVRPAGTTRFYRIYESSNSWIP